MTKLTVEDLHEDRLIDESFEQSVAVSDLPDTIYVGAFYPDFERRPYPYWITEETYERLSPKAKKGFIKATTGEVERMKDGKAGS